MGNGGQPGQPRPKGVRKFMVEFKGDVLAKLPFGVKPEPVLWASRGTFSYIYTEAVPDDVPGHWRAQFDLTVEGKEPVEMRCSCAMATRCSARPGSTSTTRSESEDQGCVYDVTFALPWRTVTL